MVLNTLTVGAAVTPTVVKTYASHASQPYSTVRTPLIDQQYTDRKTRAQRPTAHISYDEGLNLIRQFLNYASHHTVEEIQAFTSQWVPNPRWVRTEETTIPEEMRVRAAGAIIDQLGDKGIDRVGGKAWWQWRRDDKPLQAEWIEMRADHAQRKASGEPCKRVMLYVHGGAYFFGSVDEHRYQMQRHARKLKARVYAPRYRLAPQYPFPCGLQDCLAAYLHLLTMQDPSTIILSGDSAGGGMVVSMLVILRDQGIPLPAGAILISPWVDLTHSFPSVAGENKLDYIPAHGFMQRPSAAWPPPNADDMNEIGRHAIEKLAEDELPRKSTQRERSAAREAAVKGFSIDGNPGHLHPEQNSNNPAGHPGVEKRPGNTIPGAGHDLSIMIDGKMVEIKDQIQMYANNQLISHPLVSPVLQPTLGGLPPLLILTGGGEMLRDEQIYLAHKAANPAKYPPGEFYLNEHPEARDLIHKYKPTDVQLQVWDDLCHVAPTLSFTRPAKFMYRSVAQFGAWVLAKAQKTEIEIMDDDDVSVISSGEDTDSDGETRKQKEQTIKEGAVHGGAVSTKQIGKAGDPIPAFKGHMVRQRVNRHGVIYPLDPPSSLPALQMAANEVGVIKPGPVRKWMAAKIEWDTKYAKEKRRVQKQRIKEIARGFQSFGNDDVPPPSALAGRRGATMPKESKTKRSWGMSLWSLWGSSHDEKTVSNCSGISCSD
jgi:acetyl esterase/lipase